MNMLDPASGLKCLERKGRNHRTRIIVLDDGGKGVQLPRREWNASDPYLW
jgi:hypothetical protein